jgi:penicillin amidase
MSSTARKIFFRGVLVLVLLAVVAVAAAVLIVPRQNDYQVDGTLHLKGIAAPIEIVRDAAGIPYVRASSRDDLFFGQGYATAQDRLFQMHLTRLFAQGRLGELAGERTRDLDLRLRTFGFHRLAKKQAALLDDESRRFFQRYADGVNAMIDSGEDRPLEFSLAGIEPERWTIEDSLAITFYMSWNSSANLAHELLTDQLERKLGDRAGLLRPLNWNPELETDPVGRPPAAALADVGTRDPATGELLAALLRPLEGFDPRGETALGSNNWAVGAGRSPSGKPIVANDPHLDARMLPGVWHPVGLVLPEARAIGATIPGLPGVTIGRGDHVAISVTNAYADIQDLYLENVDPNDSGRYLDGGVALPFDSWEETFRFKDGDAPGGVREEKRTLRATRRGPVVTDVLETKPELQGGQAISLRWAPAETMSSWLLFDSLLTAKNIADVDADLAKANVICLNFVFADTGGGLGFRVSGRPPRRAAGTGIRPIAIDKALAEPDTWQGFLGPDEMPHAANPERGWLATANHLTAAPGLPYYYTDFAASSYRYRRIREVLDGPDKLSVSQHWQLQRDTKNLLAARLVPIFVAALEKDEDTRDFAQVLKLWNFRDEAEGAAPLVFQEILRQAVLATMSDEMGEALAAAYLDGLYYWQERFESLLVAGESPFFDDKNTPLVEDRDAILVRAAEEARKSLAPRVGNDPKDWQWGKVHTITFFHPLRREGFLAHYFGSEPLPMSGSAETLLRAWYDIRNPYPTTFMASLRFVADLGDDDKMLLIWPGGVAARVFHPHFKDQIPAFMSGEERHIWVSDRAIATNAVHKLELRPY